MVTHRLFIHILSTCEVVMSLHYEVLYSRYYNSGPTDEQALWNHENQVEFLKIEKIVMGMLQRKVKCQRPGAIYNTLVCLLVYSLCSIQRFFLTNFKNTSSAFRLSVTDSDLDVDSPTHLLQYSSLYLETMLVVWTNYFTNIFC